MQQNSILSHVRNEMKFINVLRMKVYFLLIFWLSFTTSYSQIDVLIIGGGAGGTSAGIQAARTGAKVTILESTPGWAAC
jgi:ribulose 1,5-bisphosphate synthetase/thiazole synthase